MLWQLIGEVIQIDYNTESATRGKFARIVVEVTFSEPLISQFLLDGNVQKVEDEILPNIYFGFLVVVSTAIVVLHVTIGLLWIILRE